MSLRTCSQRIGAALRTQTRNVHPTTTRRAYAAAATAASSLPADKLKAIEKEASLRTPDPPSDSQTARLVNSHTPYMVPTYVRPPPVFHKGEGCYLWDVENRQYLDFTAGIAVNALGHCDPEMSKILYQQSQTLVHASNLYYNPWTGALSQLLVEKTKEAGGFDVSRAFICNSGSEANEAAIKFARKYGRSVQADGSKFELVSFNGSFHGRTMGSLSATPNPKYQKPFSPMIPGFRYGTLNDVSAIKDLVTDSTCGVIVEPIQGEGGVNVATPEFLIALRKRCTEVGAVLIHDEIQCGMGRTGKLWAHADLPAEAHPDIVTTAKALGNGFPIGATLVTEDVSSKIVTGDHGTTFGGNPLGCRVAHYIVSRLSEPELLKDVLKKEARFRQHFVRIHEAFPDVVQEVRGRGLILGLQLNEDPTPVITAARERGLLIITCGTNTLRFVPPLIISDSEIDEGMKILQDSMHAVFKAPGKIEGTDGQQEMRPL
ncbi:Acetylornithine aminotransferase, mitochondrial [Fulvia fulva]|uniref:acetylornithine transaminase n=1 Tax=Passalora fulva TaxID=5499 RepID=A0A9Q8L7M7_PASFU|nr:Acetylornithine aminotransferase, mitochondrial [Fulvia fulva]KAK4634357.1 Acetylornithine aminotransferase, mitochondrial [Fulvia fulva]KAK4636390.1 Acetylornithine aminotransferase, mitochondrial [Fulvia fulva]UJO12410.1 Acetylornithine aminotransferase, mitochondrial [Fulvia fulva]WPV09489.1 Acetylornithine aminotransferase, mitochondrial [Fulvia fulva]WPV25276.1 Acetylornithine aminotransferase, mitochondrial [Fulvia fulva]